MLKSAMLSAVALLLTVGATSAQNTIIAIDGSSTVFPITEAMAEEFQKANKGIKVTVGIGGTGGGFKKFCRGEIDISDASRPIRDVEREECKKNNVEFIELPIALDALSVMVNPKNDWAKEMTVAELKKIWEPEAQGKVTNWKQVRGSFPDRPLKLYGAGSIPEPTTISPRRSSAKSTPRVATSPHPRTTMCWFRASPATSMRSASSVLPIILRTRAS